MHSTRSSTRRARLTARYCGHGPAIARVLALVLGLVLGVVWVGAAPPKEAVAAAGVEYGGRTSAAYAKATRSVTLKKPAGAKAGDVLVASFAVDNRPTVRAKPEGWTSLLPRRVRAGRGTTLFAYYLVVTARDAETSSWTWTLDRRQTWSGGVARYVGVDRDRPIDTAVSVASSASARSTLTVPGVRTTTHGTMLIGSVGAAPGRFTTTPPAGWAEVWDTTRGKASAHAYGRHQESGETGVRTWRVSSARVLAGWMAALRPERGRSSHPDPSHTASPGPAPTASFTVVPSQGTSPLSVAFTDTSTGAPTSWLWDFGDGTTGTQRNPVHTYAAPGTYTVSLRATNASGSHTVTRAGVVSVQAPGPDVLIGAGDIAHCDFDEDTETAALVNATPGTVYTLGDNAYPDGTAEDYANCYEPTWGAFKDRTRPVVGNHDYFTEDAAPYYAYFGAAAGDPTQGWYSYDLGTDWHVVVLNSNCAEVGGCEAGSPQEQWLRADLAASTRPCTVAMWHNPRFSSGFHGNDTRSDAFWQALYEDGAELVLTGHEHNYERFAPQDPSGVADEAYGIRQFVVGTGGKDLRSFDHDDLESNSEVGSGSDHGVLKLTLHNGSYDWNFLPVPGDTLVDNGSTACHGAPS